MRILDDRPHRWLGVWREFGEAYRCCPSEKDFICPEINGGGVGRTVAAQQYLQCSRHDQRVELQGLDRADSGAHMMEWLLRSPDFSSLSRPDVENELYANAVSPS